MIAIIQRVEKAIVKINSENHSQIEKGLLIFLGITHDDNIEDINWLSPKIVNLRIFNDENGVMNKSCLEENAEILIVSQFTLHAKTKKGNRPSYIEAAKPEIAIPLYEKFIGKIEEDLNKKVKSGVFGADMKIELINDGPVTIIIDTKNKK
ncbi:MAG: D-aminoacyl-tRNA deacylase [Bacteroidales bacterium]|jgi:D-tyrosyl-tRNA(Tyr) deacylase|nr:D-aminoacyl-tRNA deacylase [Bacteroidales bacterium]MCK9497955.1 D-aminoacyl-tRNA deacylase [Bacteroidales bacterium]MDY0314766.1 D-aminoacyl-tRNA deacylase [Bacteroidales bacterium]